MNYCENAFSYKRRATREVMAGTPGQGGVGIGGSNPVRIQSMITCDTMDTDKAVQETIDLEKVGCEIVRITAPTIKDAANLENIVRELRRRNCFVPIVADIHFKPDAAMEAVKWVEKVRVNPGNFADSKKFAVKEYTDEQYQQELDRIEEKFKPLVLECVRLKRAMRIGTNHGSLSDRIMNRFGDSPRGMVESSLEFARIARKYDFHNFVFSMKSSNPKVMIEAYRLLVQALQEQGADWNYPIHLGVTEAGDGEDGRIKSAIGIGALLEDGIGDTIRVSLTEDSPREIPVAKAIVARYNNVASNPKGLSNVAIKESRDPYVFSRRVTQQVMVSNVPVGGEQTLRVESALAYSPQKVDAVLNKIIILRSVETAFTEIVQLTMQTKDDVKGLAEIRKNTKVPLAAHVGNHLNLASDALKYVDKLNFNAHPDTTETQLFELISEAASANKVLQIEIGDMQIPMAEKFFGLCQKHDFHNVIVALGETSVSSIYAYRLLAAYLQNQNLKYPLMLRFNAQSCADQILEASTAIGAMICDGFGDIVRLEGLDDPLAATRVTYNILQAAGARTVKTDYVACPSCGRTLF
ncbi:MAG: (E)-4-hydroxy-3-methylbut-2-enyl-diphosphate synthase, partial [Verrucomicrobiota bacterium]|nr:(E)-4-hydroxy-3-methylbut-2-enyl-diphosphate synthase [Verrucomicrobiota bacterium]